MRGPLEIQQLIVRELSSDRASLRACASVSQFQNALCRPLLFSDLAILLNVNFMMKVIRLYQVLQARPALLDEIRSLAIVVDCRLAAKGDLIDIYQPNNDPQPAEQKESRVSSDPSFPDLLHLLAGASGLRKLIIAAESQGYFLSWHLLRRSVIDPIMALRDLPSLDSLDVSYVQQLDRQLIVGIGRRRLRSLRMQNVRFTPLPAPKSSSMNESEEVSPRLNVSTSQTIDLFATIEELDTHISYVEDLLSPNGDVASLRLTSLKRLASHQYATGDRITAVTLTSSLVRSVAGQLTSLSWLIDTKAHPPSFTLDELNALRDFRLVIKMPDPERYQQPRNFDEMVLDLFDIKSASHMEQIDIYFLWVFMPKDRTLESLGAGRNRSMHHRLWAEMDDILCGHKFPDLKKLTINFKLQATIHTNLVSVQQAEDHLTELLNIQAMLPRLRATGKVVVDIATTFNLITRVGNLRT